MKTHQNYKMDVSDSMLKILYLSVIHYYFLPICNWMKMHDKTAKLLLS